jgi:cytochrome c oxidase cbb3-type subunit III
MKAAIFAASLILAACGPPAIEPPVLPPNKLLDFAALYSQNCAGCHGPDGKGGVALALSNPVYLAIADDAAIRAVTAKGVAGTAMPAFAQSAGGSLTDPQIDAIVQGMRAHWSQSGSLSGAPPYSAPNGDATRGAQVYNTYCSSCHASGGRASSIVDPAYLSLVSDQNLRTTVIAGRPELGAPDWRGNVPGKPMSAEEIADVVAWLAAQRTAGGAQ